MRKSLAVALLSLLPFANALAQTQDDTGATAHFTPDRTVTATLGSLNAAVTIRLTGRETAGVFITTSDLNAVVTPEVSMNGSTWFATRFVSTSGAIASTLTFGGGADSQFHGIASLPGSQWARVRVSTYTSGTSTGTARATIGDGMYVLNTASGSGTLSVTQGTSPWVVSNGGTFAVQLTGATNNINNISGTVSLPTGASTAANQTTAIGHLATLAGTVAGSEQQVDIVSGGPLLTTAAHDAAFGTAGSADAQVRTIQGVASMTPVQVGDNGASLTVDGTVTVTDGAGALNVIVDSSALPTGASTLAEQQTQTASLSVLDDWDETDRAKVNPIVGQAGVQGGSGTVSANTVRTAPATDVPTPLFPLRSTTGTFDSLSDAVTLSTAGVSSAIFQIDAGLTNAVIEFEGSQDGTNWDDLPAFYLPDGTKLAGQLSPAGGRVAVILDVSGFSQVRAIIVLFTSGSATARLDLGVQNTVAERALSRSAGAILGSVNDAYGPTVLGLATTAAPTFVNNRLSPLSFQLDGDLRVEQEDPLPAGTNQIGGVNVSQWAGVNTASGSGTSTGAARVELANNGTGTVASITSNVVPGNSATSLGKDEDQGGASGDRGVMILGIRQDAASTSTNANFDYVTPAYDSVGAAWVRPGHANAIRCTVTTSTATTIQAFGGSCAAPGAGFSIYITDIVISASGAGIAADAFPTLKYGTGGTCGTGTTVFYGVLAAAAVVGHVANLTVPIKIPANNEVCWITTTAGSKFLVLTGFIAPG